MKIVNETLFKDKRKLLSLIFKDKTQGRVNAELGNLLARRENKKIGNCLYQYNTHGQWDYKKSQLFKIINEKIKNPID